MWFKKYSYFDELTTAGWTDAQKSLVHQKKADMHGSGNWLLNKVVMHMYMYAKFDQNIPCCSIVMSISTNC